MKNEFLTNSDTPDLGIKYGNTNLKVFILDLTKIFIGLEETYFLTKI